MRWRATMSEAAAWVVLVAAGSACLVVLAAILAPPRPNDWREWEREMPADVHSLARMLASR